MTVITWSGIFLIICILLFVALGFYYSKKMAQTSEDFLLAGRGAPFWLLAAAYMGGAIGGSSVAGWTGYGFAGGMSSIWSGIFPALGCTLFVLIFARRLNTFGRKTGAVTITDFICARYGEKLRLPSAIIAFFRPGFLTGMQYLAIAVVLNMAFGLPLKSGVIIAAIVILAYLVTAGQVSALVTQWLQATLQSLAIVVFAIVVFKISGGAGLTFEQYYTILPASFVDGLQVSFSNFSVWFLTLCLFYLVDPWVYMWAYIGETPRISQNAQLASCCAHYFGILIFGAGMAVAVAVANNVLVLPEGLSNDAIYSYVALNETSIPIGTILVVGLLMTIISCGSSFAMNGVTIITHDIYAKCINKNATEKQMMFASRMSVVVVSAFGVCGALWLPSLVPLWILAQAIAISGLLCPVLGAWFWKRATTAGALAATLCGGIAAIAWAVWVWIGTGSPGTLVHGLHCAHIGLAVEIVVFIVVSLATKPEYEKAEATSYKKLGDDVKQAAIDTGTPEKPGLWGFLGAEKPAAKILWTIVGLLFIGHYILVCVFKYEAVGVFTMWLSIISSVVILIVFFIMGGVDTIKFSRGGKKKIKA